MKDVMGWTILCCIRKQSKYTKDKTDFYIPIVIVSNLVIFNFALPKQWELNIGISTRTITNTDSPTIGAIMITDTIIRRALVSINVVSSPMLRGGKSC